MRTTTTLDPDVQALVRTVMRERGISFKEAVNAAVRAGFTQKKAARRAFVQRAASLGGERNLRWDKTLETAAAMEDEELTRKLALRK